MATASGSSSDSTYFYDAIPLTEWTSSSSSSSSAAPSSPSSTSSSLIDDVSDWWSSSPLDAVSVSSSLLSRVGSYLGLSSPPSPPAPCAPSFRLSLSPSKKVLAIITTTDLIVLRYEPQNSSVSLGSTSISISSSCITSAVAWSADDALLAITSARSGSVFDVRNIRKIFVVGDIHLSAIVDEDSEIVGVAFVGGGRRIKASSSSADTTSGLRRSRRAAGRRRSRSLYPMLLVMSCGKVLAMHMIPSKRRRRTRGGSSSVRSSETVFADSAGSGSGHSADSGLDGGLIVIADTKFGAASASSFNHSTHTLAIVCASGDVGAVDQMDAKERRQHVDEDGIHRIHDESEPPAAGIADATMFVDVKPSMRAAMYTINVDNANVVTANNAVLSCTGYNALMSTEGDASAAKSKAMAVMSVCSAELSSDGSRLLGVDVYGRLMVWECSNMSVLLCCAVYGDDDAMLSDASWWSNDEMVLTQRRATTAVYRIHSDGQLVQDGDAERFASCSCVRVSQAHHQHVFVVQRVRRFIRPRRLWTTPGGANRDEGEPTTDAASSSLFTAAAASALMDESAADASLESHTTLSVFVLGRVTPEQSVERRLRDHRYDDALALCQRYSLGTDRVYQCRWLAAHDVTKHTLETLLGKITADRIWVLEQCRTTLPNTYQGTHALLSFGLNLVTAASHSADSTSESDHDAVLEWAYEFTFRSYLDALQCWIDINADSEQQFDSVAFGEFRDTPLQQLARGFARNERLEALNVLLRRYRRDFQLCDRLDVLGCIPETTAPLMYRALLPHIDPDDGNDDDNDGGETQTTHDIHRLRRVLQLEEMASEEMWHLRGLWQHRIELQDGSGVNEDDGGVGDRRRSEVVSWYIERALCICSRSGQAEISLALLRIAVGSVSSRDDDHTRSLRCTTACIAEFVQLVYVYDSILEHAALRFDAYAAMPAHDRIALALKHATQANLVHLLQTRIRGHLLMPHPWSPDSPLFLFAKTLPPTHVAALLSARETLSIPSSSVSALAEHSLLSSSSSSDEDDEDEAASLGVLASLTSSPLKYVEILSASSLAASYGEYRPLGFFVCPSTSEAQALLVSIVYSGASSRSSSDWIRVHSHMSRLCSGVLADSGLDPVRVDAMYLDAVLDVGHQWSLAAEHCRLHPDHSEHVVVSAAKRMLNSAPTPHHELLKHARSCLLTLSVDGSLASSPSAQSELDLLDGIAKIASLGVHMTPLEARMPDQRDLVLRRVALQQLRSRTSSCVPSSNVSSTASSVSDIAHLLGLRSCLSDALTRSLIADVAFREDHVYLDAARMLLRETLLDLQHIPLSKLKHADQFEQGQIESAHSLAQEMAEHDPVDPSLLAASLASCPDEDMHNLLSAWSNASSLCSSSRVPLECYTLDANVIAARIFGDDDDDDDGEASDKEHVMKQIGEAQAELEKANQETEQDRLLVRLANVCLYSDSRLSLCYLSAIHDLDSAGPSVLDMVQRPRHPLSRSHRAQAIDVAFRVYAIAVLGDDHRHDSSEQLESLITAAPTPAPAAQSGISSGIFDVSFSLAGLRLASREAARVLSSFPEVDPERFTLEPDYRSNTILSLLHSRARSRFEAALVLGDRHGLQRHDLLLERVTWAFEHIEAVDELESNVLEFEAELLKAHVPAFEACLERVYNEVIDGRDLARIAYLHQLRVDCGRAERDLLKQALFRKHIHVLERLRKAKVRIDYKKVIEGGQCAKDELIRGVNDQNVNVLSRVAGRLAELQTHAMVPAFDASYVFYCYLCRKLATGVPSTWSSAYTVWLDSHRHHFQRLSATLLRDLLIECSCGSLSSAPALTDPEQAYALLAFGREMLSKLTDDEHDDSIEAVNAALDQAYVLLKLSDSLSASGRARSSLLMGGQWSNTSEYLFSMLSCASSPSSVSSLTHYARGVAAIHKQHANTSIHLHPVFVKFTLAKALSAFIDRCIEYMVNTDSSCQLPTEASDGTLRFIPTPTTSASSSPSWPPSSMLALLGVIERTLRRYNRSRNRSALIAKLEHFVEGDTGSFAARSGVQEMMLALSSSSSSSTSTISYGHEYGSNFEENDPLLQNISQALLLYLVVDQCPLSPPPLSSSSSSSHGISRDLVLDRVSSFLSDVFSDDASSAPSRLSLLSCATLLTLWSHHPASSSSSPPPQSLSRLWTSVIVGCSMHEPHHSLALLLFDHQAQHHLDTDQQTQLISRVSSAVRVRIGLLSSYAQLVEASLASLHASMAAFSIRERMPRSHGTCSRVFVVSSSLNKQWHDSSPYCLADVIVKGAHLHALTNTPLLPLLHAHLLRVSSSSSSSSSCALLRRNVAVLCLHFQFGHALALSQLSRGRARLQRSAHKAIHRLRSFLEQQDERDDEEHQHVRQARICLDQLLTGAAPR